MATRTIPRTDEPSGAEVRDRFRPLTEADIRAMTDPASFDRGRSYFRGQRIFDASLRGTTLQAMCHGSSGGPYRVEATLVPTDDEKTKRPVAGYLCTCPRGGFCKHVVALLLTWTERPETVAVRPTVAELLAGKGRDELARLVELMVRREPDLIDLIELAPPAPPAPPATGAPIPPAEPGQANKRTVSSATIRRQIAGAFRALESDGYGDWYSEEGPDLTGVQQAVSSLLAVGEGYAAAGRWADAAAVYGTVLEAVNEGLADLGVEDDDLWGELDQAAAGLARCLEAQAALPAGERLAPNDRAEIIERLVDHWEVWSEGSAADEEEDEFDPGTAIAAHTTPAERAEIERRLRDRLVRSEATNEWTATHEKQQAIWMLSLLRGGMSDEELLEEYRAAGLWEDAAAILVELDRVEEAVALAGRTLALPHQLTAFAELLVARGGADADRALDLVEGRLWEQEGANVHGDLALLTWLAAKYATLGRPDRALAAEQRRFKTRPGVDTYRAVRAAAMLPGQPPDRWPSLRPGLLDAFKAKEDWASLVRIYLDEGETAEAIAALHRLEAGRKRPSGGSYGWGWSVDYALADLRESVARAAEASHPDEAIRLYTTLAEDRIEARQRPHYQAAAGLLARARAVYETQGRADEWQTYIMNLRETNKRLRALREELDALDLR